MQFPLYLLWTVLLQSITCYTRNLIFFYFCLDIMICQMLLTFLCCVNFTMKQDRGIGSLVSLFLLSFVYPQILISTLIGGCKCKFWKEIQGTDKYILLRAWYLLLLSRLLSQTTFLLMVYDIVKGYFSLIDCSLDFLFLFRLPHTALSVINYI